MDLFPPITGATAWSCNPGCNGTYYSYVALNGGAMPYTVTFDPAGPAGGASPNGLYFNSLCQGETYTITVSDANGCTGTVDGLEVVGPMAPTIVNQLITPSCPNGATGGFILEFSEADSILVNSGQVSGTLTGNVFSATSLAPGTYTIWVSVGNGATTPPGTSGPWCSASFAIEVPATQDPCGTLTGKLFADLDADCNQGASDPGLPHRVLSIEPGGLHTLTDAAGNITTELLYGSYSLDANLANYTVVCPSLPAAFALDASNTSASIDIAMEPGFGPDASAFLVAGAHRAGFPVQYTVSASNQGPFTFSGAVLNLHFNAPLALADNGGGVLAGPGHLQWDLGTLAPFAHVAFVVTFTVPANASLIGTQVSCTTSLDLNDPDSNPANDEYVLTSTIIGAYDPNDKLASTSSRSSNQFFFLDADQWIDYTIRFQNTGTAEAINVHLTDTISTLLDLASLEILGASHPFTAQLRPGRVLRFDFPGIMLPDSTSDLLGSQGFASFRLRPVNGLGVGAVLENNADIFFDFNEPVRTNTATLVAEFSTGIAASQATPLLIRPNPAHDLLQIDAPPGTTRVEIIGADGKVAMATVVRPGQARIGLQQLPVGIYMVRCFAGEGLLGQSRFVRQ